MGERTKIRKPSGESGKPYPRRVRFVPPWMLPMGGSTLTITLGESASLRSSLVLNGRGGASSELARPLLSAWLAEQGVRVVEATEYFVDSTYKTNPLEYRPDQQVLTLTIEPGGAAAGL